jgi:hypothetical protein
MSGATLSTYGNGLDGGTLRLLIDHDFPRPGHGRLLGCFSPGLPTWAASAAVALASWARAADSPGALRDMRLAVR